MGTAIFMVLMVCGYWYTSRDLSTRFKIKRSFGWDVYFLVALYGSIFVLQGVIATGLLWLLLLALSAADNTFHFTSERYADWQMDFMNWSFGHPGARSGDAGLRHPVLSLSLKLGGQRPTGR